MSKITIFGYASFNEWVEAGCPGAVSFNPDGSRKERPRNPRAGLCKHADCPHVEQIEGLCWGCYSRGAVPA